MSPCTADEPCVLFPSAHWEHHSFPHGPMRQVLMHVVTDLRTSSAGQGSGSVRACVRLMLADGSLAGLLLSGPLLSLWPALHAAAAILAASPHVVFDADTLSAMLEVDAAGMRIALEHNARVLPAPVLTAGQVMRLQRRLGLAAQLSCEHSWHHPLVGAWLRVLDPVALAYADHKTVSVNGVAPCRLAVYNFLVGRQGAYCLERVQAVTALPWLLPLLITVADRISCEVREICHAIDAREPLFQAVADVFDVPRETVRWLGRATLPGHWRLDTERLRRLLALLSWLPFKWRPSTVAQFEMLIALGNVVAAPLEFDDARGCRPMTLRARRATSMRRWLKEVARPGGVMAKRPGGLPVLVRDAADAADFLRALLGGAIAQMPGCSEATCMNWVVEWSAGISLYRLMDLSQQWHAATLAYARKDDDDDEGTRPGIRKWPTVLPKPFAFDERIVMELTTASGLLAEGRALQHCVAGYTDRCLRMNSIIVSVRDTEGWPCSTAELHLTQQGVIAGQHRARSNADPDSECERAIAGLVRFLNLADCGVLLQQRMAFQRAQAQRHNSEQSATRQHLDAASRYSGELAWQLALA